PLHLLSNSISFGRLAPTCIKDGGRSQFSHPTRKYFFGASVTQRVKLALGHNSIGPSAVRPKRSADSVRRRPLDRARVVSESASDILSQKVLSTGGESSILAVFILRRQKSQRDSRWKSIFGDERTGNTTGERNTMTHCPDSGFLA